jgi:UDPglucose 6-dehydrogenase
MQVCVIGTGYVGLVTGACLAHVGHHVICVDNDVKKVEMMRRGESPIFEPGLSEILTTNFQAGRLEFTTDLALGVNHGEILFIAVGTPSLPNGETNTSYVEAVATGIGRCLSEDYKVIVNKSTVPIGSGDWVKMLVIDRVCPDTSPASCTVDFDVVSNPEFLREGSAIFDTFNPDRIVLGSASDKALQIMEKLYEPIIKRKFSEDQSLPDVPVLKTDLNSAEMVKYAANAFLATKISFINEVANICDRVGADVVEVSKGIGLDSRIGSKFLKAGIGWGGSCFPKDVSALIHTANDYGYQADLLKAAVDVNCRQRLLALEKLQGSLKILKGKVIGLLGLTFKPDTDDMRDAPSLDLIEQLSRLGAKVKAYDPIISKEQRSPSEKCTLVANVSDLIQGCDALVLVTEWDEFQSIPFADLVSSMNQKVMIDCRNFLDSEQLKVLGVEYHGMGR